MLSRGTRISIFGFVCAFAHNCRLPINMSYYKSRAEACGSLFSSWAAVLVVKVVVIASRVAFHYTLLIVHSNSTDGSRWHSLFELTKPQYFLFCFCLYRRRCGCVHWAERRCFVQSSRPHVTSEQPFCPSFETSLLPLLPIFPSPFFYYNLFPLYRSTQHPLKRRYCHHYQIIMEMALAIGQTIVSLHRHVESRKGERFG